MNEAVGKWLMIAGGLILLAGLVVYFFGDRLSWIGNLPGDIRIERENVRVYVPVTSMILLSVLLSLLVWLIRSVLR